MIVGFLFHIVYEKFKTAAITLKIEERVVFLLVSVFYRLNQCNVVVILPLYNKNFTDRFDRYFR